MKQIAFIVNPHSGTKSKNKITDYVQSYLDHSIWNSEVHFTESAQHASNLTSDFVHQGFAAVVAVGGDGTLNAVAQSLIHSNTALGIIPLGSGNGFARHLKIPRKMKDAIETFNHCETIQVDYGLANERFFISTCGTGFDAVVANQFAKTKKRGLINYMKYIFEDIFTYHPEKFRLRSVDISQKGIEEDNLGKSVDIADSSFLITFANANQWGYEAQIAPQASVRDGLLDICIMSKYAIFRAPILSLRLFIKKIDKDIFMQTIRAKDVYIQRNTAAPFHIDGDAVEMPANIRIRIVENGLNLLINKRF